MHRTLTVPKLTETSAEPCQRSQPDKLPSMPTLIPSITNAAGERLGARLDLPLEGRPLAYAIFAHCFTCTKNIKAASHISRALNRQRIAVLRFDFTGLGDSEGDFAETNFTSNVADLVAVARFLAEEFEPPTLLIGHSLGGSAALQAAQHIPSVVGVVTIAAPADTSHLARLLASTKATAEQAGEARVTIGGATFRLKKQFFDDLEQANMQRTVETLDRALLVCTRRPTRPWTSTTPCRSSPRRATPRASSRWTRPTTCCPTSAIRGTPAR